MKQIVASVVVVPALVDRQVRPSRVEKEVVDEGEGDVCLSQGDS